MRTESPFGKRKAPSGQSLPKRKYFLAYEGSQTEKLYFDGIKSNRDQLKINSLIDIIPILRSYNEEGCGHPKKIVEAVKEYIDQMKGGSCKVSQLAQWTVDYINKCNMTSPIPSQKTFDNLIQYFKGEGINPNDTVRSLDAVYNLIINYFQNIRLERLKKYLESQQISYCPGYDKVCIIVDRDPQSFKAEQYDYVVEKCQTEGYQLYVTNPCFEFWLLLHFDEVMDMNPEDLRKNAKMTNKSKRRFTEYKLRELVPGYQKNDIRFSVFLPRIEIAIRNEKKFEEDVLKLKDHLGSNVGCLIAELQS